MPDTTPAPLPPLPYAVARVKYGYPPVHEHPTKVRADGRHDGILTPDEAAVWEHLQAVTAHRDYLKEQLDHAMTLIPPAVSADVPDAVLKEWDDARNKGDEPPPAPKAKKPRR